MLDFQPEIIFAKFSSYQGLDTTGEVKRLIGINQKLEGRDVVIIEDIIDTGITMSEILPEIRMMNPASLKVATLLFKPEKLKRQINIDYCAMEIPNEFIVGYGLDYNGLGRNLKDIYTVVEK
jgi:hypoxanthine phosphoribosyltransferase